MAQIVGIGANVQDTIYRLDTYPQEDTKQKAVSITQCGGGPCTTGLVAAAKLGADCAYSGNVSADATGEFLAKDLADYGVDISMTKAVPDTTGFRSCIWLADDRASRTCVFDRGNVPGTTLGEAEMAAIQNAQLLMVDGNDLDAAVSAAMIARQSGTMVLYDAGGLYPGVERLLAQTDILIPSEEFARRHTGETSTDRAAIELFQKYQPKVVVVTQGKEGGLLYDGNQLTRYPAFPVEAVDTNGSGDVFHGAFAFALTQGWDYLRCCVFSSAVSALKCTQVGSRKSIPNYDAVLEFLRSRGVDL